MAAIYPISDLRKHPSEVKAHAQKEVVHLTENGRGAYVFMSEQYFEDYVARKQEEAAWEAGLLEAVEQGMRDFEQGRTHTLEELDELISQMTSEGGKEVA